MTEARFVPANFTFTTINQSIVSPGYILLTPYSPPAGFSLAAGPIISLIGITTAEIIEIITEYSKSILNGPYIYDQKGVCFLPKMAIISITEVIPESHMEWVWLGRWRIRE